MGSKSSDDLPLPSSKRYLLGGLLVVLVFALVWSFFPFGASDREKLALEKKNLDVLEKSRWQWALDNPGRDLDAPVRLLRYLPEGRMLKSPFGGLYDAVGPNGAFVYSGILDIEAPIVSPYGVQSGGENLVKLVQYVLDQEESGSSVSLPSIPRLGQASEPGAGAKKSSVPPPASAAASSSSLASSSSSSVPSSASPSGSQDSLQDFIKPSPSPSSRGVGDAGVGGTPLVVLDVVPRRGFRGTDFSLRARLRNAPPGEYEYSFNGGEYQKTPSLSVSYQKVGNYRVDVRVRKVGGGDLPPATGSVLVENRSPLLDVAVSPAVGLVGQLFRFSVNATDLDGDALEYSFNGGEWVKQPLFAVRGKTFGEKSFKISVRDSQGAVTERSVLVKVGNSAPVVRLSASPKSGARGQEFLFVAEGEDQEGDPLLYSFNGGPYGKENFLKTAFSSVGSKRVRVQVKDSYGNESELESVVVDVVNRPPVVSLSPKSVSTVRGESVVLTATAVDPDGDPVLYSFNGGPFQSSNALELVLKDLGVRRVSVKAKDSLGLVSAEARSEISVKNRPPSVVLVANPPQGRVGDLFKFVASGADPDGDPLLYSFNGGPWTGAPVGRVTASTPGEKRVFVRVKDSNGAEVEASTLVVVLP